MSRTFRSNQEQPAKLPWRELPPRPGEPLLNAFNSYVREYRLGECSVVVTREFSRWHLSIAHPKRYPSWDEVAEARYNALPAELWMAMILPPPSKYINVHPYCFQMIETTDRALIQP